MNIKETKELLVGLGEISVLVKKIAKNGINVADLIHLKDLADAMPILEDAVKDIKLIGEELKELDQGEVLEIIATIYAQAKRINEA